MTFTCWVLFHTILKSRTRMLTMISEQFETRWDAIYSGRMQPGPDQIEQIESYERLHAMTLRMIPVWLLAADDIRRFSVALAPVWTLIITIIVQAVLSGLFGLRPVAT